MKNAISPNPAIAKSRKPGRPLSFDRDAALYQAMLLFWRHGFESTSIGDLTAAMQITPPSLYAAFGDKKGLFREAVKRYLGGPVTAISIIDDAPTAREAARQLLHGSAIAFTGCDTPAGCLLASSAISCSSAAADVQAELAAIRGNIQQHLKAKMEEDVSSGELALETDVDALAGHVMALIQGMSTLARDGAARDTLERVANMGMQCWPTAVDARKTS